MSVGLAVRRGVDMDLDCGANRGGYDLELSDLVVLNTSVKQGFGSLSGEPPLHPTCAGRLTLRPWTVDGQTSVEVRVLFTSSGFTHTHPVTTTPLPATGY
jgi:hypothetical protein